VERNEVMTESHDKQNPPVDAPEEKNGGLPISEDEERSIELPIEEGDFDAQPV
jgi:hypothetical protein